MQFLSDAWLSAADRAIKAAAATAPSVTLTIDQHIDGCIDYRVIIDRQHASVARIDATVSLQSEPDAAFRQTIATARSIATGDTDAHQAFLLGQITFAGDIDVLIARRDALDWLQQTLAPVMAATDLTAP